MGATPTLTPKLRPLLFVFIQTRDFFKQVSCPIWLLQTNQHRHCPCVYNHVDGESLVLSPKHRPLLLFNLYMRFEWVSCAIWPLKPNQYPILPRPRTCRSGGRGGFHVLNPKHRSLWSEDWTWVLSNFMLGFSHSKNKVQILSNSLYLVYRDFFLDKNCKHWLFSTIVRASHWKALNMTLNMAAKYIWWRLLCSLSGHIKHPPSTPPNPSCWLLDLEWSPQLLKHVI
jgi:hypothetical protein